MLRHFYIYFNSHIPLLSSSKHFYHSKRTPCTHLSGSPHYPLPPAPGNHQFAFVSYGFPGHLIFILEISYKWSQTTCDLLYLLFSLSILFLRFFHLLQAILLYVSVLSFLWLSFYCIVFTTFYPLVCW